MVVVMGRGHDPIVANGRLRPCASLPECWLSGVSVRAMRRTAERSRDTAAMRTCSAVVLAEEMI